jgi:hypothetical protein
VGKGKTLKRRDRLVFSTLTTAVVLFAFQNCTEVQHGIFPNLTINESGGGTGNGYDGNSYPGGSGSNGKTYDDIDVSITCADGTHLIAAISVDSRGEAFLIRANCQSMSVPKYLLPSEYSIANSTLYYNGVAFTDASRDKNPTPPPPSPAPAPAPAPNPAPTAPFSSVVCQSSPNTYPIYHLTLTPGATSNVVRGLLDINAGTPPDLLTEPVQLALTQQSTDTTTTYHLSYGTDGQPNSLFAVILQAKNSNAATGTMDFNLRMSNGATWAISGVVFTSCTVAP